MISSSTREVSANTTGARPQSRARKVVGVLLNTVGIASAAGGVYFTVQVVAAILDIVQLSRSQPKTGPAVGTSHGAAAFLGMFDLAFIFVFGLIAVMCFLLAGWLLEPFRRWRDWRATRKT